MQRFDLEQPFVGGKSSSCFWTCLFLWLSPRPVGHRLCCPQLRGWYRARLASRSGSCSVIPCCQNGQFPKSKTFYLLGDSRFRYLTQPIDLSLPSDDIQHSYQSAHYAEVARYFIGAPGDFVGSATVTRSCSLLLASCLGSLSHIDPDFPLGTSTSWTQRQKAHLTTEYSCCKCHTFTYLAQPMRTFFPYPGGPLQSFSFETLSSFS
jgi:hypothetical protein